MKGGRVAGCGPAAATRGPRRSWSAPATYAPADRRARVVTSNAAVDRLGSRSISASRLAAPRTTAPRSSRDRLRGRARSACPRRWAWSCLSRCSRREALPRSRRARARWSAITGRSRSAGSRRTSRVAVRPSGIATSIRTRSGRSVRDGPRALRVRSCDADRRAARTGWTARTRCARRPDDEDRKSSKSCVALARHAQALRVRRQARLDLAQEERHLVEQAFRRARALTITEREKRRRRSSSPADSAARVHDDRRERVLLCCPPWSRGSREAARVGQVEIEHHAVEALGRASRASAARLPCRRPRRRRRRAAADARSRAAACRPRSPARGARAARARARAFPRRARARRAAPATAKPTAPSSRAVCAVADRHHVHRNVARVGVTLQAVEQRESGAVRQPTSSSTPLGASSRTSAMPSSVDVATTQSKSSLVREVVEDAREVEVVLDDEDQASRTLPLPIVGHRAGGERRARPASSSRLRDAPDVAGAARGLERRTRTRRQWVRLRPHPVPRRDPRAGIGSCVNVLPRPTCSRPRRHRRQLRELGADREAEPGAAVFAVRAAVGLPERLEDDVELVARDPVPVSRTAKRTVPRRPPRRRRSRRRARWNERVRDQVREDLLQALRVGGQRLRHRGVERQRELETALVRDRREAALDLVEHAPRREFLGLHVHRAGLDLRQVEDVVDQRQQVVARGRSSRRSAPARRTGGLLVVREQLRGGSARC